jgi:hypothetical protein
MARQMEKTRTAASALLGFVVVLNGHEQIDVAAIKGFEASDPRFYENFGREVGLDISFESPDRLRFAHLGDDGRRRFCFG